MAPIKCYYNNCTNTSANRALFRLPVSNELRLQSWIKNSGVPDSADKASLSCPADLMIDSNEDSKKPSPKRCPRIQQLLTLISLTPSTSQSSKDIEPVTADHAARVIPKKTPNRSVSLNAATIKDEPVDLSNDNGSEQAHVNVKNKLADVDHQTSAMENNHADVIMKREPADVEYQTAVMENNSADVTIKKEAAHEDSEVASAGDDSGDVVEDVRSPDAATVKEELDIGLTVLQPPDIHFMLLPCKPEPPSNSVEIPRHRRSHSPAGEQPGQSERSSEQTVGNEQVAAETNHGSGYCGEDSNQANARDGLPYCDLQRKQCSLKSNNRDIKRKNSKHPFRCNTCSKRFKGKSALTKHLKIHTNYRPFSCVICRKGFTRKEHLTKHLITHSDEHPYYNYYHHYYS